MCGIAGLLALDGRTVDAGVAEEMAAALVHRGPDSAGLHADGPVALAARRLSIIDLEGGDQPMANEDGSVVAVQNGELYEHARIARELQARGHRLRSRCDTEVLPHLYEERGARLAEGLRGMFAVAVWDARARRLVLARDPFGIKPLFYREADGVLSFASELKGLARQPGFDGELDLAALDAYLAFNSVPSPLTIYRGVRKLPAGHVLVADAEGVRVERFARVSPAAVGEVRTEGAAALADELRARLRDSVRAHLVADVPVGVFLSGGIDSSLLCALAAQETSEPVRTFSIGFRERSFDELSRARMVARRYGTDHHELVLGPEAADLLAEVVEAFDEPFADSSALPTYAVSRLAAGHVKVALSGEGGDELFGGYFTYVADLLAPRLHPLATAARPLVEALPSSSRRVSLDYRAKRFARAADLPALERHHAWKEIFSPDARAALLEDGRRADGADPLFAWRARWAETAAAEPLARLQDVDIGTYLVDDLLTKTDRASMAHSLEVRVPFCDAVVAELALSLPTDLKVRALAKKRLLRRAAHGLVPASIVHGPKRGFSIPAAAWLRGELASFARDVLAPDAVRADGVFRPAAVTRMLDEHQERRDDHSRPLWGLLCFSLWWRRVRYTAAAERPRCS
jgi:asparagine synthase (glutamine-hydrolysing)